MSKMGKLATPEWILKGYDSEADYPNSKGLDKKIGRTFKIRECPKCGSSDVAVVLGREEGKGSGGWECKKCKWEGKDVVEKELNEDEFMRYLDDKDEEVA